MNEKAHTGRELSGQNLGYRDIEPGDWFDTPCHTVTLDEIDRFADLSGDRFEIHMSDAAALEMGFPARVAHGLLILSIVDGLKNNSPARLRAVASLGWNWKFGKPVFAGDRIEARITILSKRHTRNPARSIVTLGFRVANQHGIEVQSGENLLMIQG